MSNVNLIYVQEFKVEAVKKFLEAVSIPYVVLFNKDPVQREYLSKIFSNPEDAKVKRFFSYAWF